MLNPDLGRPARHLLPYLALVLVHLLSGVQMDQPLILADELGYLGNARYLSGTAPLPDMHDRQFYHFGYSLFLLPAFWLFNDPVWTYKAVMVINAFLAAAVYFPLWFILTSFIEAPARAARWIAFACGLYPSLVLYSSFAWSENAFIPLYALAVALFGRYLAAKSSTNLLLFALVAGFLYTVHPRAVPVLAAILAYLILAAAVRAVPVRQALLGVATLAAVSASTWLVNQVLEAKAWAGAREVSAARLAERLIPDSDLVALIERALGQILYLSLASHGLFLVGLAAMVWLIARRLAARPLRQVLADPTTGVPILVLTTTAGIFAAACTLKLYSLHGPRALRGADFIHGRYNEALALFALAFALAAYWRRDDTNRRLAVRTIAVAAAILALTAVVMLEVDDALVRQAAGKPGVEPQTIVRPSDVDAVAVPGVHPLVELVGGLDLYRMAFLVLASFLTITLAMRLSRRGGLALLMLIFALFAYANHRRYLLPLAAKAEPRLAFVAQIDRLGPIAAVSHDTSHREPGFLAGIQYLLPQTEFRPFDGRQGDLPRSEAVIASTEWTRAASLGARFVTSSGRDTALWVLPGDLQSRLPATGNLGVTLGTQRNPEVRETGFYRQETFRGAPGRWTNGAATLTVPVDPRNPPAGLEVEAMAPGRDGTRLELLVNGVALWNRPIPPDPWSRRFSLDGVPVGEALLIEIGSDTFTPARARESSGDRRTLGVVVLGIRLLATPPASGTPAEQIAE